MKTFLFLLGALPLFSSCTYTIEEKASNLCNAFIEADNNGNGTCEMESIKVDSLYESVLFAEGVLDSIQQLIRSGSELNLLELEAERRSAMDSMSIYEPSTDDSSFIDNIGKMASLEVRIEDLESFIKENTEGVNTKNFFGWQVEYKCKFHNPGGEIDNIHVIFVTDKNCQQILWHKLFVPYQYESDMENAVEVLKYLKKKWDNEVDFNNELRRLDI